MPAARKRALMTLRGLVNRRNGAETARAGRADCAMRADNSTVSGAVVAVGRLTTMRDLRRGGNLQQRFFGEAAEVFAVINAIDGAAELGLPPHLIDPLDLAELFPCRGHQLFLLSLHDCVPSAATARWRGSRFSSSSQVGGCGRENVHRVPRRLPAAVNRRREQRIACRPVASPATAHRGSF